MTNEEKYHVWLRYAQYDLDSAAAMFLGGRWFYVVFMCQQAIEKLCKGLYVFFVEDKVPRIHNIKTIFFRFKEKLSCPIDNDVFVIFDRLSAHYISNRYPDLVESPDHAVSKEEAEYLLAKTKEVFSWLQTLKPSTGLPGNTPPE
jgi:HEPN domain-containing protein